MNREILFRGKRTDNGQWVEGYLSSSKTIGVISSVGNYDECIIDPSKVCQYTGLTDKNGNRIFEGDIVKWDEKEWGCPFFETVTWNYELFGIRKHDWKHFCEVVGNVHDNPELLGENNT